ncbi:hypothetical protein [Sphingobacterium siyangense]
MRTLKINWLRTGLVLSFFLLIGAFWVLKAMEKKEEVKVEINSKKRLVTRWFNVVSYNTSNPDNKNDQILGTELSSPPSSITNPTQCSTGNNLGIPCAVSFEMDPSIPESEIQNTTVSDVEIDHSTTADSYARKNP